METQKQKQYLQNFADSFNLQIVEYFEQDKRKKQRFLLVKNNISVSNPFDYSEMNNFMLGMRAAVKNKIEYLGN